jgi:hypothetical protein
MLALALTVSFMLMAGGDLLVPHGDSDCAEHCDDSCENCGDCLQCLPTVHMIAAFACEYGIAEHGPAWAVQVVFERMEGSYSAVIDHPPQNAS